MTTVVLASASPRRQELLALLVSNFETRSANIDEAVHHGEDPGEYVLRLSRKKAASIATHCPGRVVIGADTCVAINQSIMGKPLDRGHARRMLASLSNTTHHVFTGITACRDGEESSHCVRTAVTFAPLSSDLIESYLDTDEPWDKAGAYAIQGRAGSFVTAIDGSYSSVVGLPLLEARLLLKGFGVDVCWAGPSHE